MLVVREKMGFNTADTLGANKEIYYLIKASSLKAQPGKPLGLL
jgi:hypothetical protein